MRGSVIVIGVDIKTPPSATLLGDIAGAGKTAVAVWGGNRVTAALVATVALPFVLESTQPERFHRFGSNVVCSLSRWRAGVSGG